MTELPPPAAQNAFSAENGKTCGPCGQPFVPRRPHQRYCSDRCRKAGFDAKGEAHVAADVELLEVLTSAKHLFNTAGLVTNTETRARWKRLEDAAQRHINRLQGRPE